MSAGHPGPALGSSVATGGDRPGDRDIAVFPESLAIAGASA